MDDGVHATRRAGARHEVSTRVTLRSVGGAQPGTVLEGWALNVSRGGIRVILEEKVEPGDEFDVTLLDGAAVAAPGGDDPVSSRGLRGCIVWLQEESDGVVAGIAFKRALASSRPPPPSKPAGG